MNRDSFRANNGRYRTNSLFVEFKTACRDRVPPTFTIKEEDHKGCVSMYKLYMSYEDEYAFAMDTLGSYEHWRALMKAEWFMTGKSIPGFHGLEGWREEKELRDKAIGKTSLLEAAKEGNVQAAKVLYEGKKQKASKRGRPSEEEKQKYLSDEQKIDVFVSETLSSIKGREGHGH